MSKHFYLTPKAEIILICAEEMMQNLPGASQFDNDGDGHTDQTPVIPGDPDGGIGAKEGFFDDEESQLPSYNAWK